MRTDETAELRPADEQADSYSIDNEQMQAVAAMLEAQDSALTEYLADWHPADIAELMQLLAPEPRTRLIESMGPSFPAEALPYLDTELQSLVLEYLDTAKGAVALAELDTDDAVQVLEDLEEPTKQRLLDALPEDVRDALEEGLAYPDQSAGRLMNRDFVALPEFWTVGDAIDYLRQRSGELPEHFYVIFIVDPRFRPSGGVLLSRILTAPRKTPLKELMRKELHCVPTTTDQEEVGHLFRKYGLVEAPVVNEVGRLLGVITVDDVVDVITEEQEEDYLRAGGLTSKDLHAGLWDTVRTRFPWLLINLASAALAALVVGQFEGTIAQLVTLAVLMPVIASMGGNVGIQSMTVAVRAVTTHELQRSNAFRVLRKEMLTGLVNGVALGAIAAAVLFIIYRDAGLSGIFLLASIFTLTVGGLMGAVIPLMLDKLNIDPAIASGVFITMLTDMLAFFTFLGLAAWLLL